MLINYQVNSTEVNDSKSLFSISKTPRKLWKLKLMKGSYAQINSAVFLDIELLNIIAISLISYYLSCSMIAQSTLLSFRSFTEAN